MNSKKRGRAPANWMYLLANADLESSPKIVDYQKICELYGISVRAAQSFIKKLNLQPSYVLVNRHAVRQFLFRELQQAARLYIDRKN